MLVIGGGGGGSFAGGGGGAGGLSYFCRNLWRWSTAESSVPVSSGAGDYPVVIGAGGAQWCLSCTSRSGKTGTGSSFNGPTFTDITTAGGGGGGGQ